MHAFLVPPSAQITTGTSEMALRICLILGRLDVSGFNCIKHMITLQYDHVPIFVRHPSGSSLPTIQVSLAMFIVPRLTLPLLSINTEGFMETDHMFIYYWIYTMTFQLRYVQMSAVFLRATHRPPCANLLI